MTIGVYCLNFSNTSKVYIGQSINIEQRFIAHKSLMTRNKASSRLNKAFKLYGVPSLTILIQCSISNLNNHENYFISLFNSYKQGFNGIDLAQTIPIGIGEKHSRSVYSNDNIIEAFHYLVKGLPFKEIELLLGVKVATLSHISCGQSHKWLEEYFPEEYKTLIQLKGHRKDAKNLGIKYPPLINSDGIIFSNIENMAEFTRIHNIHNANLYMVLNGKRKSTGGWKIYKGELS